MCKTDTNRPRLLIEEWLPTQAIGVECVRENKGGAYPPHKRIHTWWTRKPLVASRAAVLASLLPAGFDRRVFERLLGFYTDGDAIISKARELSQVGANHHRGAGHGKRAFANVIRQEDIAEAHAAMVRLWGEPPVVLDPMAGGGSIPLESARLGIKTFANDLNPVACSVLEATVAIPFQCGPELASKALLWGDKLAERFWARMSRFYRRSSGPPPAVYYLVRTVPCPETGHPTPLISDWTVSNRDGSRIVAEPVDVDAKTGSWSVRFREVDGPAKPEPLYARGAAVSLFTGATLSPKYIKSMARSGMMGQTICSVVVKAGSALLHCTPDENDFRAMREAEEELARVRHGWERDGIIPTERIPEEYRLTQPVSYGARRWSDMFTPRQLLAMGVSVEELARIRPEIVASEGAELGEAVVHLLSLAIGKLANYNCALTIWGRTRDIIRAAFGGSAFVFRPTFGELAAHITDSSLHWAVRSVVNAYKDLAALPRACHARPAVVTCGSASHLVHLVDKSVSAVVVDPPYGDSVQHSELANFFYVWLKRTLGRSKPEWFGSDLCDSRQEAVLNNRRHRGGGAREFFRAAMRDVFIEARRVLRDDGVATLMFTHREPSVWAALFDSLASAGFVVTRTWVIQTEVPNRLHRMTRNAVGCSVFIVCRKRGAGATTCSLSEGMVEQIKREARNTASSLGSQGFVFVDRLAGAFGSTMEVLSSYAFLDDDGANTLAAFRAAADAVAEGDCDDEFRSAGQGETRTTGSTNGSGYEEA